MQVRQAAGGRQGQLDHALDGHGVAVQVVEQRAMLMVVRHQPQLSPCAVICGKEMASNINEYTYIQIQI